MVSRDGDYEYYSRTEAGKDYPIYCRAAPRRRAPEEIILDVNVLAEGHEFFSLGALAVSPDANLLAYSTDVTGFREFTLHVKDLRSGELLAERIEKTRSVAWANDSATLFYVQEDAAKRAYRLYRHTLGSGERCAGLRGKRCALQHRRAALAQPCAGSSSARTAPPPPKCTASRRTSPARAPRLIAPRTPEHEYHVDHRGDLFYIVTNDRGRNFRLVTAPVSDPRPENWTEVIPHREDVMLEDVDLFARHCGGARARGRLPAAARRELRDRRGASGRVARAGLFASTAPATPSSTPTPSASPTSRWSRPIRYSTTT